jgi:predicted P-loop ATPase
MRWQRPYPLYGLEKLDKPGAEDKRIVLVSGEKTADAVQELMPESIVMTWCGGDDSARYADLEPIAGRANVILWRDADESGRRAEEVLAAELGPMVGNLFLVNVDDMPKAWDGADARDDGWSESRLRAWLQELLPADEMPRLRRHGPRPASLVKPAPIADPTADEDREEKPPTAAAEFGMDSQHWRAQPWRHFLILGGEHNDRILNNDHNAAVPLRFAEELRGLIRYNEVTGTPTVVEPLPWGDEPGEWRDDHTTRLSQWLNRIGIMTPRDMLRNAVEAVARERSFNPIRDYLRSLQWDGTRRLDGWLPRYAGAVDSPYHREIGARWLISAVARGLKPGTQVDTMLVLEGAEGRGKTSLLRTLGREWFTPLRGSISAADGRAALQASTCWIVEFGELAATRNADWESLKDFLTTTDEVLRRPYAHSYERVHRLAVFAGTVNGNDWLPPDGDHRRFWPVAVGRCDVAGLAEVRDQLFAEAVVEYDAGRIWWIPEEEEELVASVRAQREARKSRDEWIDLVLAWLDRPENTTRDTFAMHEITHKAIGVDHAKLDKSIQMRMGRVLAGCGMMRVKARDERGMPTWRWARPDAEINRRE